MHPSFDYRNNERVRFYQRLYHAEYANSFNKNKLISPARSRSHQLKSGSGAAEGELLSLNYEVYHLNHLFAIKRVRILKNSFL